MRLLRINNIDVSKEPLERSQILFTKGCAMNVTMRLDPYGFQKASSGGGGSAGGTGATSTSGNRLTMSSVKDPPGSTWLRPPANDPNALRQYLDARPKIFFSIERSYKSDSWGVSLSNVDGE